jgi:predicted permease
VVVLGHRLWTRTFGADPGIIGRDVLLNERPHTVVAVMPPAFDFTVDGPDLWLPAAFTPAEIERRDEHYLYVFGRTSAGTSLAQLNERLAAAMAARAERFPDEDKGRWLRARPMMEQFVGDYRQRIFLLMAAVLVVLLIACGNVSNLLLARGTTRARELAVRGALGAGQGRLVRQLLTESLLLGILSAAAGSAIAHAVVRAAITYGPQEVPRLEQAAVDVKALAFAIVLAVAAALLFGLVPAWRASRADVNSTLKDGARGSAGAGARDVVRSALMAGEVALALVLLVGSGLLIRSAVETGRVPLGFEPSGLFTGRIILPELKYREPATLLQAAGALESGIARVPGVAAVAMASAIPGYRSFSNGLLPEGRPLALEHVTQSDGIFVTAGYFRAVGLPLLEGRGFAETDREGAPLVVILNETAARRMWPNQSAVGRRLTSANPLGPTTVVGVVGDIRLGGPAEPAPPTFYVPYAQLDARAWGWTRRSLFVLARGADPGALTGSIRRVVSSFDAGVPLFNTMTMDERLARTTETARFNTILLSTLGALGLVLAVVGIYGVIGYFAAQRTAEIGLRVALGASRRDVVRLVVRQALWPVLAGLACGTLGALFATRALASELVNVRPTDPWTFLAVALTLLVAALGAAFIPARRAAALDPTRALQST